MSEEKELTLDERFANLWIAMKVLADNNNSLVSGIQNIIGAIKAQRTAIVELTTKVDAMEKMLQGFETYKKENGKKGLYQ